MHAHTTAKVNPFPAIWMIGYFPPCGFMILNGYFVASFGRLGPGFRCTSLFDPFFPLIGENPIALLVPPILDRLG